MNTDTLVQELINKIDDHNHDPEPVHDEFLENIPVHTKLTLEYALKLALNEFKRESSKT